MALSLRDMETFFQSSMTYVKVACSIMTGKASKWVIYGVLDYYSYIFYIFIFCNRDQAPPISPDFRWFSCTNCARSCTTKFLVACPHMTRTFTVSGRVCCFIELSLQFVLSSITLTSGSLVYTEVYLLAWHNTL